jgi:hypothetical protein
MAERDDGLSTRLTVAGLCLLLAVPASAQEGGQSLASEANDPTASLMAFQLQYFYTPTFYKVDDVDGDVLQFRAAIPFTLGGVNNIARLTIPYVTDSPSSAEGWFDATLFNLAAFDQSWGRYGIGAVALLPTGADGLSAGKWGLGPAFGFVARPSWGLAGLFNQNIFTVAGDSDRPDVNLSTLQPIVNVTLPQGWSAGSSDMTLVYDWDAGEFTSLPLGVKVAKLFRTGRTPLQVQGSYERNFYDDGTGPKDTFGLTLKLLVPK